MSLSWHQRINKRHLHFKFRAIKVDRQHFNVCFPFYSILVMQGWLLGFFCARQSKLEIFSHSTNWCSQSVFPFQGLRRQIPQQHLMIRSDSSSRVMFKSYLQYVPSGPTREQSFLEQYILAIFFAPFRDNFSSSVSCKYAGLYSDKTAIKALGALPGREQTSLLRRVQLEKGFKTYSNGN